MTAGQVPSLPLALFSHAHFSSLRLAASVFFSLAFSALNWGDWDGGAICDADKGKLALIYGASGHISLKISTVNISAQQRSWLNKICIAQEENCGFLLGNSIEMMLDFHCYILGCCFKGTMF